ncbi:MAG: VirB4 family type IV secretion system protein, partial [Eubacterium aggregans]
IYDEAHMIIDKDNPEPMKNLSKQERRARKYKAGVWVASQQICDFLYPSVKLHGQAILEQPTYKLILGMDGKNLSEVSSLYHLRKPEEDILKAKKQWNGLFFVGGHRMNLQFKIAPYMLEEYFGTASGGN